MESSSAGSLGTAPARDASLRALAALRRFHLGDPSVRDAVQSPGSDVLPALLHPFRDTGALRSDFPLHVPCAPLGGAGPDATADDPACAPVAQLLRDAMTRAHGSADRARILADNLKRVERIVRDATDSRGGRADVHEVLVDAGQALEAELALPAEAAAQLRGQWEATCEAIPAGGELLGFDRKTSLHLVLAAARTLVPARRDAFRAELVRLRDGLRALLDVEHQKDADAHDAKALGGAVGSVGSRFLDPGRLAKVIGNHRGSIRLEPHRRARVEQALGVIEEHIDEGEEPFAIVVHEPGRDPGVVDRALRCVALQNPCAAAANLFDAEAERRAIVFRAARTARLELDGVYDPERHDPWIEALDWQGFLQEELLLVTPIVAVESAADLCGERLTSLSRLLVSGRPVHVLAMTWPAGNPAAGDGETFASYRLELGYLGVGHREAFVQQGTAARPAHLYAGIRRALSGPRTALHVVDTGLDRDGHAPAIGPWLHAGAAIEGRAHPLFRYDPEAGATWARRLDFSGNPQPEEDWPVAAGPEDGPRFTFADFALLEPEFAAEFAAVDEAIEEAAMMPVAEALAADTTRALERLPCVVGTRQDGSPARFVVSRRLMTACSDRLDFWRTLQELSGVRNEHVREAVERARQEAGDAARAERLKLEREHRDELDRVREEAVGEAMGGLARSLLELGPDALALGAPASPSRPASAEPEAGGAAPEPQAAPGPEAQPEPEVTDEVEFEEPWIDTPLCTSCNDCRNINSQLFIYDDNKQALIGDPAAGTYLQLVMAAEKCPARCIHPGLPLNKGEPNLDELVGRAAPFNR